MSRFRATESTSNSTQSRMRLASAVCAVCLMAACTKPVHAQVLTVSQSTIDAQYLEFHPTNITLPAQPLDAQTRQELIRIMDAEQGFAMRPLPKGTHGLVLHANGQMNPTGSDYASALRELGVSVKPGERVVVSDVRIVGNRMIFELNGGPEKKHRFLRHIEIGAGGGQTSPIVRDDGTEPGGSRLILLFDKSIPALTGTQVKQLLAPIVDFNVKTPLEAYTDTLPPVLKQAILDHHVLVGMDTKMVLSALGQPDTKSRERDGDMPFEEWIYGEPPHDVQFVRINGNRVIRVEIAKVGQQPVIRADNEMGDYWSRNSDVAERKINMGDADPASRNNPDKAPAAPPSLRRPGEAVPVDRDTPQMGRVQFPKPKAEDQTTAGQKPADQKAGDQKPASSSADSSTAPASSQPAAGAPTSDKAGPGNSGDSQSH